MKKETTINEKKIIGVGEGKTWIVEAKNGVIQLPEDLMKTAGIKPGDVLNIEPNKDNTATITIPKEFVSIDIPVSLNSRIERLIKDDWIKREMDYVSVQDFVITAIEQILEADKERALIRNN